MYLVTTAYGEVVSSEGRVECWSVVLTMMRVILRDFRKVPGDSETAYGSADNVVVVGQYLWGTLQAHRIMDDFLRAKFRQHHEVAPHITLHCFEHRSPRVEAVTLNQKVEVQYRMISHMEKFCKKLRPRVDLPTNKVNRLRKKYDK